MNLFSYSSILELWNCHHGKQQNICQYRQFLTRKENQDVVPEAGLGQHREDLNMAPKNGTVEERENVHQVECRRGKMSGFDLHAALTECEMGALENRTGTSEE